MQIEILIIALVNALISNLISEAFKYLIENKGKFKLFFSKRKRSSNNDDSRVYHPNTPFTFEENHLFVEH
jgi:hypothetical protein